MSRGKMNKYEFSGQKMGKILTSEKRHRRHVGRPESARQYLGRLGVAVNEIEASGRLRTWKRLIGAGFEE